MQDASLTVLIDIFDFLLQYTLFSIYEVFATTLIIV